MLEFCDKHKNEEYVEEAHQKTLHIDGWGEGFIRKHVEKLYRIVMAADYLEVGLLL